MRQLLLVSVAASSTLAAVLAAAATGQTGRAACTPGVTKVGGVQARVFCGSAKATVKIAGKTLAFSGGSCETTGDYVSVDIGTVILDISSKKPKPDFFGLNVGRILGAGKPAAKDGTYVGGTIAIESGGKGYLVRANEAKITLSGGRKKGVWTAPLLFASGTASGTFSC